MCFFFFFFFFFFSFKGGERGERGDGKLEMGSFVVLCCLLFQ